MVEQTHLQMACSSSRGSVDYARIKSLSLKADATEFDGETLRTLDQNKDCILDSSDFDGNEYKVAEGLISAATDFKWKQLDAENLYELARWIGSADRVRKIEKKIFSANSVRFESSGCGFEIGDCIRPYWTAESEDWYQIVQPLSEELRDAIQEIVIPPKITVGEEKYVGSAILSCESLPESLSIIATGFRYELNIVTASLYSFCPLDLECRGEGCPEEGARILINCGDG